MSGDILAPAEMVIKIRDLQAGLYKLRIEELVDIYGSVRAVGKALKIDHAYLHRLANGEKQHPSKAVLKKLGLAR